MARPALPLGRWLPWALAGVGAALIIQGAFTGDGETVLAGVAGLAGVIVAFPLASLVTRHHGPEQ